MAGGAAVHLVPLRVAQIMQQILGQAGSKNGHSSWVSRGDTGPPVGAAPWDGAREMAFGAAQPAAVLSSATLAALRGRFCSEDFVILYPGA